MKLGVKEMKREYKKVNIDQIEVIMSLFLFCRFFHLIIQKKKKEKKTNYLYFA
jgi:hypothetical protein